MLRLAIGFLGGVGVGTCAAIGRRVGHQAQLPRNAFGEDRLLLLSWLQDDLEKSLAVLAKSNRSKIVL